MALVLRGESDISCISREVQDALDFGINYECNEIAQVQRITDVSAVHDGVLAMIEGTPSDISSLDDAQNENAMDENQEEEHRPNLDSVEDNTSDKDTVRKEESENENSKHVILESTADAWKTLVDSDSEDDSISQHRVMSALNSCNDHPTAEKVVDSMHENSSNGNCADDVGSNSSDDLPSIDDFELNNSHTSKNADSPIQSKTDNLIAKLTKKQREEQMKETLSKTQRMLREKAISLPYEKPKQLSLCDFLSQRAQTRAEFYNPELKKQNTEKPGNSVNSITIPAPITLEELGEQKPESKVNEWINNSSADVAIPAANRIADLSMGDDHEHLDPSFLSNKSPNNLNNPEFVEDTGINSEELNDEIPLIDVEDESGTNQNLESVKIADCSESKSPEDKSVNKEEEVDCILGTDSEVNTTFTFTWDKELVNDDSVPLPLNGKFPEIAEDSFRKKELALENYLQESKGVVDVVPQQRRRLLDLLKSDPNYNSLINLKPTMAPKGNKDEFIEFSISAKNDHPPYYELQDLKNRYKRHLVPVKKPREQHFTVTVKSKEEDSQGNVNSVENIDYIQRLSDEEISSEDETSGNRGKNPITTPSTKFVHYRQKLLTRIRDKKVKEYEEKLKLHDLETSDTDEKIKEDEEEEEIMDDEEFTTESEPEVTDEEAEALKEACRRKRMRKKSAFVDDEAEVSSDEEYNGEDEDESDDENEESDHEDDSFKPKSFKRLQPFEDSSDEDDSKPVQEGIRIVSSQVHPDIPALNNELCTSLPSYPDQGSTDRTILPPSVVNAGAEDLSQIQSPSLNPFSQYTAEQRGVDLVDLPLASEAITANYDTNTNLTVQESLNVENDSQATQLPLGFFARFDSQMAMDCFIQEKEAPSPTMTKAIAELVNIGNTTEESQNLLSLCSGGFPTQNPCTPIETQCADVFVSNEVIPQRGSELQNVEQYPTDGNNMVTTPKLERDSVNQKRLSFTPKPVVIKQLLKSSDDEAEGEDLLSHRRVMKRKRRLQFSDDEDEQLETKFRDTDDSENSNDSEAEREYDSEENEVVLPKTAPLVGLLSNDGKIRREFVENEADLSGDEEGSGDEDEEGLDDMDAEEADEEEIDEEAIRNQIGQQHIRNLIDDDDRRVRELQDILFEDGDLHGDGIFREKQFRWKTDGGFNYTPFTREDGNGDDLGEDENERRRQFEKSEKRKWMRDNPHLHRSMDEIDSENEGDSQLQFFRKSKRLRLGDTTLRKLQSSYSFSQDSSSTSQTLAPTQPIFNNWRTADTVSRSQTWGKGVFNAILASPDNPMQELLQGSFRKRNTEYLEKLVNTAKGIESTNSVKVNSRNFVFSVITPPSEENSQKRKKSFAKRPSTQESNNSTKMSKGASNISLN